MAYNPAMGVARTSWVVLWALVGTVAGCTDRPVETRVLQGALAVASPRDGDVLTWADDVDPAANGLQAAVDVRGEGVADGTAVEARVGDGSTVVRGVLTAGRVRLRVTLEVGTPPEGLAQVIRVSAGDATGASVNVRTVGNATTSCVIESPREGTVLVVDEGSAPGFQASVRVRCSHGALPPQAPVLVEVFAGESTGGVPWGRAAGTLGAEGAGTVADVSLPAGVVTLKVATQGVDGRTVGVAVVHAAVDDGGCDVQVRSPVDGMVLTLGNSPDAVPGTPVLDARVRVVSRACPDTRVDVRRDGVLVAQAPLVDGGADLVVPLPDGPRVLVARTQASGGRAARESTAVAVVVDTVAPCAVLDRPGPDARLGRSDDEEMPPNPDNGIRVTLRGRAVPVEAGTRVVTQVSRQTPSGLELVASHDVVAGADGAFSAALPDLVDGVYTVTMATTDLGGNRCPARGVATGSARFVVDSSGTRALVSLPGDVDPADGTLVGREDADPVTAGMQVLARVDLPQVPPPRTRVRVRFQPVNVEGQAVGSSVDAFAEPSSTRVETLATLPDARYRASALVTFLDGRPSLPSAEVPVRVDGSPPRLQVLFPEDGGTVAEPTLDVVVLVPDEDTDTGTLVLAVNGMTVGVTATEEPGPVWVFHGVQLRGALDGRYALAVSAADTAGNLATRTVNTRLDRVAPSPTLAGYNRNGDVLSLAEEVLEGPQPRTLLDISTGDGLAALDYDLDATTGLQYGFAVELPLAECATLDQPPSATLRLAGLADDIVVSLQESGAVCRGVATAAGSGITLPEGDGQATVLARDRAGNTGARRYFFTVVRQPYFVRITAPVDGARVGAATLDVRAVSSLSGSGTCVLRVDGMQVGAPVPLAPEVVFGAVPPPAMQGDRAALEVTCTADAGAEVRSQAVRIIRDDAPPSGARIVLGNGEVLPAFFNLAVVADGPAGHPRFLKDLAVDVDAEEGRCSSLGTVALRVEPAGLPARDYLPRQTAAGAWAFVPGTGAGRCRARFAQVDLGAAAEPGLEQGLTASVADTAGNVVQVGPVTRLSDRAAPVVVHARPAPAAFTTNADVDAATPGVQVELAWQVLPDGRPATASLSCGAPVECPAGVRDVPDDEAVFGLSPADAVTFPAGSDDVVITGTVTVTDAALNATVDSVTLWLDRTEPTLTVTRPQPFAVLGQADDTLPLVPGAHVPLVVEVSGCGRPDLPGLLSASASGANVLVDARVEVTADGTRDAAARFVEGDDQPLLVRCAAPSGLEATVMQEISVDLTAPGAFVLSVVPADVRAGTLSVSFPAPGDDGQVGQLAPGAYELAASRQPLSATTFDSGTLLQAGAMPRAPGMMETLVTDSLLALAPTVHVALRVTDDAGNRRVVSAAPVTVGPVPSMLVRPVPADVVLAPRGGAVDPTTFQDDAVLGEPTTVEMGVGPGLVRVLSGSSVPSLSAGYVLQAGGGVIGCGRAVHVLPDLDGDGRADVLAGCAPASGRAQAWASSGLVMLDLVAESGAALADATTLADVDGDGAPDLVISAPVPDSGGGVLPRVFILFGNSPMAFVGMAPETIDLAQAVSGGAGARVEGPLDSGLGTTIVAVGNVDGQPGDELVMGAPGLETTAGAAAGGLFVLRGGPGWRGRTLVLDAAGGTDAQLVAGGTAGDGLGRVLAAMDVDGDSTAEVVAHSGSGTLAFHSFTALGALDPVPALEQVGGGTLQDIVTARDLTGDMEPDLLIRSEGGLRVWATTGPPLPFHDEAVTGASVVNLDGESADDVLYVSAGSDGGVLRLYR